MDSGQAVTQRYSTQSGANTPISVSKSEIHRELNKVMVDAEILKKLSGELIQRLSAVISPQNEEIAKEQKDLESGVSTPFATNIRKIHEDLELTKKALNLILDGLEL